MMRESRNCRRQFSRDGAKAHHVDLFVLLSAEVCFSYGCGALCCVFLAELSRRTGGLLKQSANPRQRVPSAVPWAPIRSPSSFRVTASFVRLGPWEIRHGVRVGSAPSGDG